MNSSYDSLSINGYSSLMQDPYMLAALQSYNPNFRGTSAAAASAYDAQRLEALKAQYAAENNTSDTTQTVPAASQESEGGINTGLVIGGALALAATAGAIIHHKGNGKGFAEGWKNIVKGFKGEGSKAVKGATEKLTVVKNAKNELHYLVPNKTITLKDKKAADYAKEFGIDLKKLFKFKDGETALNGGKFTMDGNKITFRDGKLSKIFNSNGQDITKDFVDGKLDTEFITKVNDFIENSGAMGKGWAKGLEEMNVTRQIGDDIVKVTYRRGKKPEITHLTTLERLTRDSEALKNYLYEHPELKEVFNSKDFLKNGKILNGTQEVWSEIPYDNRVFRYENGEIVGFTTQNGKYHKKGSETFGSYMLNNEEKVNKYREKIFKNKQVPKDVAIMLTAA